MNVRSCWELLCLLCFCAGISAQSWPGFRGPAGNGICAVETAPVTWGPETNVKWKVELPQPANGSPIVIGDKVFLACAADSEGKQRSLHCFSRLTGEQSWVRTVEIDEKMPTHKTNPYCGSTPASDGECIVIWHGSAGLFCYDLDGEEIWKRDLGEFRHMWGYGTSPVIHGGKVILNASPGETVFLTALDIETGETIWRTDEPVVGDGQRNESNKYMGSWCTPVIIEFEDEEQVLCTQATRVVAYDPEDGKIIWFCRGVSHARGDLAYSSPVVSGDVCVVIAGFKGPGMGIRLGGKGDVTETHRLWRKEDSPQSIGSGVSLEGRIFIPHAEGGGISCVDPKTGDELWQERSSRAQQWGSIVFAAGRMYLTNQQGETIVFAPNTDKFESIARNDLGEAGNSTPAFSDGEIFIRTHERLYCIVE